MLCRGQPRSPPPRSLFHFLPREQGPNRVLSGFLNEVLSKVLNRVSHELCGMYLPRLILVALVLAASRSVPLQKSPQ